MYAVFKALMDKKGVKPSDVAKATGIAPQTLSAWKKGESVPKADKIQKIAEYFGVTTDYLMTGDIKEGYYINEETARVAQEIFENKDLRALFDSARGNKPENLMLAAEMLRKLKETNPDG